METCCDHGITTHKKKVDLRGDSSSVSNLFTESIERGVDHLLRVWKGG